MDDDEFETIRRWAEGLLATDKREEVRAAAKAILMLTDEVERLRVEIWHDRLAVEGHPRPIAAETHAADEGALYDRLRGRLTALGRILPHRQAPEVPGE